jgi:thioredoxin reductase (NADPH)
MLKKLLFFTVFSLTAIQLYCADEIVADAVDADHTVPVVVIGSGPAGLTSAVWTQRSGMKTIVLTGEQLGGQVSEISKIANWPGKKEMTGLEMMEELQEQAKSFGAELVDDIVTEVNLKKSPFIINTADGKEFKALAVIIATGAKPLKPDLPGVNEYWGKGVGICSICDAPFSQDKDVIVVGGNDYGAERAQQLAAYAKKVTIVEPTDRLTANAMAQNQMAQRDNIEIKLNTVVKGFKGDGKNVTTVILENTVDGSVYEMPIHAAFLSAGTRPNTSLFKDQLQLTKEGYIQLKNCTQLTSQKGIFAAGMVEDNRYGKAGNAIGRGVQAALDTVHYLQNEVGYNPETDLSPSKKAVAKTFAKTSDGIQTITTKQAFEKLLATANKPVFLYAYSPTCLYCTKMAGRIKKVAQQFADKIIVIKIDVSKVRDLVESLQIRGVPHMMIFKGSQIVADQRGKMTEEQLRTFINNVLNNNENKENSNEESI